MQKIGQVLEEIRLEHGGVLQARDVVDEARDPESPLHVRFEWDDTQAAEQYRIWQARELIQVCVRVLPGPDLTPIPVYVSLVEDRQQQGGGYRRLEDVLADPVQRQQLLKQASKEFRSWTHKYEQLQELAGVFKAMRRVEGKIAQKEAVEQGAVLVKVG